METKDGGFVFWVNQLSIHTQPLVEELARDFPVTVVASRPVADNLRVYATVRPVRSAFYMIEEVLSSPQLIQRLASMRVHIFWGLGSYAEITNVMPIVARLSPASVRFAFSEPWNPRGFSGALRGFLYWKRAWHIRVYLHGVLATGDLAVKQFSKVVGRRVRVVPFSYAPALPGTGAGADIGVSTRADPDTSATRVPVRTKGRVLFVGSLDERKNPRLLLDALAAIPGLHLDVLGDGPLRAELEQHPVSVQGRVMFHGIRSNEEVGRIMSAAGLLVLPSRFDGWGAVVQESLLRGVPVLVSDACGSSTLARRAPGSAVFREGDRAGLAEGLISWMRADAAASAVSREAVIAWSARSISPQALAHYLVSQVSRVEYFEDLLDPPWVR